MVVVGYGFLSLYFGEMKHILTHKSLSNHRYISNIDIHTVLDRYLSIENFKQLPISINKV